VRHNVSEQMLMFSSTDLSFVVTRRPARASRFLWACLALQLTGSACSTSDTAGATPAATGDDASVAADSGKNADASVPPATAPDAATSGSGGAPAPDAGTATANDAATSEDAAVSDASAPSDGDVDVADFSAKLASAVCASLRTCLGEQKLRAFVDDEPCEDRFAASFAQGDFATLTDSIERGRVELHAESLESCYADTRALGCAIHTERLPASCQAAFQGKVALGEACTSGSDCMGKSYCPTTACPRVCTARGTAADSCARDEECESGLICAQGACAAPAAIGETCGGTSSGVCALGTSCVGSTKEQSGECLANGDVQIGAVGDVCTPGGTLCKEGLSCAYDGDQGFNCQEPAASGEPCHLALPTQCPASEYCTAADVTTEGVCSALPTDGQACVLGSECAGGHVCLSSGENAVVCRRVRDLAEACEVDAMCRSGRCAQGKCAATEICN
jgi:hypothetical protein